MDQCGVGGNAGIVLACCGEARAELEGDDFFLAVHSEQFPLLSGWDQPETLGQEHLEGLEPLLHIERS